MKLHDPLYTAVALFVLSFFFNMTWGALFSEVSAWESILFASVVVVIYAGVIWTIGASSKKLGLIRP